MADRTLEQLWDDAPPPGAPFDPSAVDACPEPARRYLRHAIAPRTPLARAVRLTMAGEIRLDGWCAFQAEEVIHADRGFVWAARTRLRGLPIRGADRWVDGSGAMDWRLLGFVPVMRASGEDVSRSAAGRAMAEAVWLPSLLAGSGTDWQIAGDALEGTVHMHDSSARLRLEVEPSGRLRSCSLRRWGDPDKTGVSGWHPFGAQVEAEQTWDGFTIPSTIRVGWHFGTPRQEEGVFFRTTIERATFR